MKRNLIETLMGALVLILAAGFIFFAYQGAGIGIKKDGYHVTAKFERADGLALGSDVRVGGIKIGSVVKQSLDPVNYLAQIEMQIDKKIKLPKDSSAQIVSDGLLGSKYVSLVPGGEEEMLLDGGQIMITQSSVNLETLIGKMIFSQDPSKKEDTPSSSSVPRLE